MIVSQARGSIPLLWEQIVDLSYKPHLRVISHEETVYFYSQFFQHFNGFIMKFTLIHVLFFFPHPLLLQPKIVEHHFHDLMQRYGEIVALDLTDKVWFLSALFLL